MFFMNNGFLQSLIECREHLAESPLLQKLDEIIDKELEMALIGVNKALVAVKKSDNIRSIK